MAGTEVTQEMPQVEAPYQQPVTKKKQRTISQTVLIVVAILTVSFALAGSFAVATIMAPQGPAGSQGVQGATGQQGAQGVRGPRGRPGKNGKDGANGANGANGASGATVVQPCSNDPYVALPYC